MLREYLLRFPQKPGRDICESVSGEIVANLLEYSLRRSASSSTDLKNVQMRMSMGHLLDEPSRIFGVLCESKTLFVILIPVGYLSL